MALRVATGYPLVAALVILATAWLADGVLRIDRIDPPAGSLAGGTRLIIEGEGFSGDAYAAQNTVLVGKYECHVIAYYTTSTQIVCETSEAQYEGKLTVSVTTVGAGTTSTCCFSYQGYSTPELSLVRPSAAPPGSEVKLLGPHHWYFKYDSTDLLATVGPVFFGDYICAVEDQAGDEAFYKFSGLVHSEMYALHCQLPLPRNGSDSVYEPHLAVAGSHNVTLHFEQSPYKGGVAASNPRTYMQDRSGRKYQFQVVPVAHSVAPRGGSLMGGTVLRIQGEGFPTVKPSAAAKPDGNHNEPVTLWAAGVPCKVLESSYNTLLCRTGPAPLQYNASAGAVRGLYPGSRGVQFELFNTSSGWSHIGDIPGLDASNYVTGVNYSQAVLLDKFEVVWDQQTAAFASRSKAFFIPPMDGNYTFEVAPDDDGRLDITYLDTTTGAEVRVPGAAGITNGYTTYQHFDRYSSQKSAAMLLKQGQPVLLEMSHLQTVGQAHFSVGVRMPPVAGGGASWNSRAERQTIRVSADYYGPQKTISLRWQPTGQQTWLFTVASSSASDLTDSSLALSLAWSTPATVVPVTSSAAEAVAKVAAGLSVDSKSVGCVVDNATANTVKWYITVPSEAVPTSLEDVGSLVNATTSASVSGSATVTEAAQGNAGAQEPAVWDKWYLVDPEAGQGDVLDYNATSSDVRSRMHSITGSWLSVDRQFVRDGATVGYDWVVSHESDKLTWPESHRFGVYLDESDAITSLTVTDTRNASVRLAGDFEVMALDGSSDNVTVQFDDSAATVQRKLRSLAGFGDGVRVYQSGGDKSRGITYSVVFDPYTNPGNVGDIRIGNSTLVGTNVEVKAWTDTQGSLERFLRPIPADFLRLPVPVPQIIQLDANGVPYTCKGDGWACTFNYTTDATPTVTAVTTSNSNSSVVSEGDTLTITGTDLAPDLGSRRLLSVSVATETTVTIGGASCAVVSSSATEIQCTMGAGGKGGTRHVLVEVPGKGFASSDASTRALPTMVLDALTMTTVSPSTVSAVGATIVEITGTGFDADSCGNNRVTFGSSGGVVVSCSSTVLRVMYIGQNYSTLGSNSATTVTPSVALYDADGSFLESESASTTVSVTESSVPYISVTSSGKLPPKTQVTATVSSQITDSTISEVFFRLNPHSQPSAVQMTAPPSPPSYGSPGYGGYSTAAPTSSRRLLTVASTDLLAASYASPQIACTNATVSSSVLTCKAPRLPPGGYQMYVKLSDGVMVASTEILSIAMEIYSVSPNAGSIGGNTTVTITGYGFSAVPGETVVVIPVPISTTFKNKVALCDVQTSTLYRIICRTRAHLSADATATDPEATQVTAQSTKPAEVQVVWCGTNDTTKDILRVTCWSKSLYPHSRCAASDAAACQFAYRWDDTPELRKVDTPGVAAGETLSITGLKLSDVTVHLKNDEAWLVCPSSFRSFTNINCTVPSSAPPGRYAVKLVQSDWQLGIGSGFVGVQAVISDVAPLAASLGGGVNMTVTAAAPGFNANLTRNAVSIQGVPCEVLAVDGTTLTCDVGAAVGRVKVEYYALESSSYFMPDFNTIVPRLVTYKNSLSDYWSSGKGPLAGVSDFFAVRVTGSLYIPLLGSYTFNIEGDDEAKAYLDTDGDGQFEELVSSKGDSTATKTLSPGHVPLLLLMMEGTGAARYKLRWSTPSSSETVDIPKENLFAAIPGIENAVAISVDGVLAKHNCQYTSGASVSVPSDADTSAVAARGEVTSLTMSGTGACGFFYSSMFTPRVSSVSPTTIGSSQTLRLEGTRFGSTAADLTVTVGGESCTGLAIDSSASPAVVTCTVPALPYGSHPLVLHRAGYGNDGSLLTLTYTLSITGLSPTSGSTAGGTWMAISGWGFAPRTAAQASDADGEYMPWSRVYLPTLEASGGNSTPAVYNATSEKVMLRMPASPSSDALSYVEVWVMGGDSGSSKLAYASSSSISQMYQWSSSATPSVTAFSSATTPVTANAALSLQLSWTVSRALTAGSSSKVSAAWLRANGTDVQYQCTIASFTATADASSYSETLTCTSDDSMAAGTYLPVLDVTGLGYSTASSGLSITIPLTATAISPTTGSLGGGLNVTLSGSGFPDGEIDGAFVRLGSSPCTVVSSSSSSLVCTTGNASSAGAAAVTIGLKTLPEGQEFSALTFTYSSALTAEVTGVSPSRGSTAGGTALTIAGTKLNLESNPTVTIGTAECTGVTVSSATQISCTTSEPPNGISGGGEQVLEVHYPSYGNALSSASYEYVNLWSRNTTWGGGPLPVEGDSVVVPENITVVLDVSPPKLHTIVLYGHLVFDTSDSSADLVLQAHHILVIGGSFSVGSKDTPFPGSAEIVMYGDPDSPELPGYGSKNIAVRAGDVVMHGKHKEPTWTRLDATANVGDQQIVLAGVVNWAVGDKIAIASSSFEASHVDTTTIAAMSTNATHSTLTLLDALNYTHLGVVLDQYQSRTGHTLDMRAEVAVLTRSVVFRGDDSSASHMFGAHLLMHTPPHLRDRKKYSDLQVEQIEVKHAGQAFRLGRYPMHFHMHGYMNYTSYIRGCAIHHTFNRAVTVHGTHQITLQDNVAFDNMGHAFFLEDGIETENIIQGNLGFLTRQSHALLNTDVTPATFWIVHPNNTFRSNVAAGSHGYGYWFRLLQHPDGPSRTDTVCPRWSRLGEFVDNMAHSNLFYGLRIFPEFYPYSNPCGSNKGTPIPARFRNFAAYKNGMKCVIATQFGLLQFENFTVADCGAGPKAHKVCGKEHGGGIEMTWNVDDRSLVSTNYSEMAGIRNALVISRTEQGQVGTAGSFWGGRGVRGVLTQSAPQGHSKHSALLFIDNITFVDWTGGQFYAVETCSKCEPFQGGFYTFMSNISFIQNDGGFPKLSSWVWGHQGIVKDLDGTLINSQTVDTSSGLDGAGPSSWSLGDAGQTYHSGISNDLLFGYPDECVKLGYGSGVVCKPGLSFRRVMLNSHQPWSIAFRALLLTEDATNRTSLVSFSKYNENGYQFTAAVQRNYWVHWDYPVRIDPDKFLLHKMGLMAQGRDWLHITSKYLQVKDHFKINGKMSDFKNALPLPPNATHGSHFYNKTLKPNSWFWGAMQYNDTSHTTFLQGDRGDSLSMRHSMCPESGCSEVPDIVIDIREGILKWSDPATWTNNENRIPQDGQNVTIPRGWVVELDVNTSAINLLDLQGDLAFAPGLNLELKATYLLVRGNLQIGNESVPYIGQAAISLSGNRSTRDMAFSNDLNLGSKFLTVLNGNLSLVGQNHGMRWTRLRKAASEGSTSVEVEGVARWPVGGRILLASTSFNPGQVDVVNITAASVVSQDTVTGKNYSTLTVTPLKFNHSARVLTYPGTAEAIDMRGEVGLLSSNVVIRSADGQFQRKDGVGEKFGARTLVYGNSTAHVRDVALEYCAVGGLTRACLEFERVDGEGGRIAVHDSAIAHGMGLSVNIHQSASGVTLKGNVMYESWDSSSVVVDGAKNALYQNLGVGTHRLMEGDSVFSKDLPATFEVHQSNNILEYNAAAGSDRIGFYVAGSSCSGLQYMRKNYAHSSLVGMLLFENSLGTSCTSVQQFQSWMNWDFGLLTLKGIGTNVKLRNVSVVDNKHVGILILRKGFMTEEAWVDVEGGVVAGVSDDAVCELCTTKTDSGCHQKLSRVSYNQEAPYTESVGLVSSVFALKFTPGPEQKPWDGLMGYPIINGITRINGTTFADFSSSACGVGAYAFSNHPKAPDASHPIHAHSINTVSASNDGLVKFYAPDPEWRIPADCGEATFIRPDAEKTVIDLTCQGLRHSLVKDLDGSFTQTGQPQALLGEIGGGQGRHASGYEQSTPVIDGPCQPSGEGYYCLTGQQATASGYKPQPQPAVGVFGDAQMFVLESRDVDTEERNFAPVKLTPQNSSEVDVLIPCMDHSWCFAYTCQKRLSTFWTVVSTGMTYDLSFTGTPARHFRLWLPYADAASEVVFKMNYNEPLRRYSWTPEDRRIEPLAHVPIVGDGSPHGSYYWDQLETMLYIKVKGRRRVEIRTESVVQVSTTLAMTVDEFYDTQETFLDNMAAILGIKRERFKIVSIVPGSAVVQYDISEDPAVMNAAVAERVFDTSLNLDPETARAYSLLSEEERRALFASEFGNVSSDGSGTPTAAPVPTIDPSTLDLSLEEVLELLNDLSVEELSRALNMTVLDLGATLVAPANLSATSPPGTPPPGEPGTAAPTAPRPDDDGDDSLSTGEIIAIAIGAVVLVTIMAAAAVMYQRRLRARVNTEEQSGTQQNGDLEYAGATAAPPELHSWQPGAAADATSAALPPADIASATAAAGELPQDAEAAAGPKPFGRSTLPPVGDGPDT